MQRIKGWVASLFVGATLVGLSFGAWSLFRDLPNFAPVAGLALFSGFLFQSRWAALLTPLAFLVVKDTWLGTYQPELMAVVYSAIVAPVLFRGWVRRWLSDASTAPSWGHVSRAVSGIVGCSLCGSLLFFATTNLATWWVTPWYDRSWSGLLECFINAVPFFRYTVAGDVVSSLVLFSGYLLAVGLTRTAEKTVWRPANESISGQ